MGELAQGGHLAGTQSTFVEYANEWKRADFSIGPFVFQKGCGYRVPGQRSRWETLPAEDLDFVSPEAYITWTSL